ncbi:META domain-containing protein [Acinetobacter sp. MD2(2019)]|uniref:META domain-containing protein n=1 Tax=Acinetobacter sp. MD2(2019) TaxID=2605273 RepID=UPI002D1E74AC|nr:META domain-containing protein [Acinetobacter sp. MD2(2019)]MEB3753238.1 META domain-containing protein [Acinetobacter sp. MD2(2019)]
MHKKLYLFMAASSALFLTACQLAPSKAATQNTTAATQQLNDYMWQYQPTGQSERVQVNFDAKGNLLIQTPCNNQSGTWKQADAQHVATTPLASTMMMCSPEKMQLERWSIQVFSQQHLQYQITGTKDAPTLTLNTAQGQKYQLTGSLKPEIKYQTQAQTVFFEVAPQLEKCNDQTACLRVREIHYDQNGIKQNTPATWQVLNTPIQGYQHDPKIAKIIRVKQYKTVQGNVFIYDMTVEQRVL